jgi:2-polyprenyl-6-methoxyphenol hydroxylase-like FAD-dependent oxidoreductase
MIGIVGGGIAGFALGLALQKKGVHSVVFEKDSSFSSRHQGYGLTMQQAGRALRELDLQHAVADIALCSKSHYIFDSHGNVVLYWGIEDQIQLDQSKWKSGRNCHISRQELRRILYEALDPCFCTVLWSKQLESFEQKKDEDLVCLRFQDDCKEYLFAGVAGCDGIHSLLRQTLVAGELNYLGVLVVLGISDNRDLPFLQDHVIQMSDGKTRIFSMPYDEGRCMWQLSFYMDLESASRVSKLGAEALKTESISRSKHFAWPIPQLLKMTEPSLITGYPVFDRELMPRPLESGCRLTLLGDAAHPMSPFKGQGANQALLDAVNLAKEIEKSGEIPMAFRKFEKEMISRTSSKVLGSRASVDELHCPEFIDAEFQLTRKGFDSEKIFRHLCRLKTMDIGSKDWKILDQIVLNGVNLSQEDFLNKLQDLRPE